MFKAILFLTLLLPGVSCLISKASAENPQNQTAPLTIVDVLMKYGKVGPAYPALNQAMQAEDIDAVKLLIDHGADINTRSPKQIYSYARKTVYNEGQTVLEIAIEKRDATLIKYFLKNGANPHLKRYMEIYVISVDPMRPGDVLKCEPAYPCTAVYEAIRSGDVKILSTLVEGGANVNTSCVGERTPIQAAITLNRTNMVEFLLSKGAKI